MGKSAGKIRAATVRERKNGRSLTAAVRIFPIALLCIGAGCESSFGSKQQDDPLLGIHASPKQIASPSAPGNATAQATSGPIPPLPASYTAPGTAPVASGETATLENPREIRMAGDAVPTSSVPSAGAARGSAPAVAVGNPELISTNTTANSTKPPMSASTAIATPTTSSPGGSAANIRTYEDAQQFLKQHRVTWQQMGGDGDGWKFSCGIPNPSNPQVNKTYQTSRPFPDFLSAMRAVISEIEQAPH